MATSIKDQVQAATLGRGTKCTVCDWLGKLPAATRKEWVEALADKSLQSTAVHRVAAKHGFEAGRSAMERHRRGECKAKT